MTIEYLDPYLRSLMVAQCTAGCLMLTVGQELSHAHYVLGTKPLSATPSTTPLYLQLGSR